MAVKLGVSDQNRFTPYDMPAIEIYYNNFSMYTASSGTSQEKRHEIGFWNHVNYQGAVNSSGKSADTWYTDVDITGCGHLGWTVGWCPGSSGSTHTVKITVDGVVYERAIPMSQTLQTSNTPYNSLVLGAAVVWNGQLGATSSTPGRTQQYSTDVWYSHASNSKYDTYQTLSHWTIAPTHSMMQDGLPTVPFRESLKVEQKNSAGSYNQNYYRNSGCSYMITG